MLLKNRFVAFTFIPALYFMNPALLIHPVEAAQEKVSVDERAPTARSFINEQAAKTSHLYTVKTFLNAAMDYTKGLEQFTKSDVAVSDQNIQKHMNIMEIQHSLNGAKEHVDHLTSFVGAERVPASSDAKQTNQLKVFTKTRQSIDQARNRFKQVMMDIQSPDRQKLQQSISTLKESISDAIEQNGKLMSEINV
jgi:hypothetical protein